MTEKEDVKEHLVPSDTEPQVGSQPVLPRDVFSNRITLFLYFLVRDPIFWVSLVLFGTFLIFAAATGYALLIFFSFITGCSVLILLFVGFIGYSQAEVSSNFELEQEIRFLIEIRDIKPGINIPQWDIVASRMNDYLFETGHYPNRCAFYDGRHCCKEFKENYLLSRKDAFDVAPLNDSVHGENGGLDYFKRQVSKDYYDSFDEHLAKVHEEGLKSRCVEV